MANGLRKLIRKARRFSNPSITNGRLRKFGQRLRVEELEERIAPAANVAVDIDPGDFVTWDGGASNNDDDAWQAADDGILFNGANSTALMVLQVDQGTLEDFDESPQVYPGTGAGDDTATLNLTVVDNTAAGGTDDIYIVTNQSIGTLDLSGVASETLRVWVHAGVQITAVGGNPGSVTIDGSASGAAATQLAHQSTDPADGGSAGFVLAAGEVGNATAAATIGTITLPTGVDVELHVIAGSAGGGTIGEITDGGGANTGTLLGGTFIQAGAITNGITWGGIVNTNAGQIEIDVDQDDTLAGIAGGITFGSVVLDTNNLVINADGIGGLEVTSGITDENAAGSMLVDSDVGATDDGCGVLDLGPVTLDLGGTVDVDGGDTGFTSVTTGAVNVSGGSTLLINTTTDGSLGAVQTGAIDVAGASTVIIQPAAASAGTVSGATLGLVTIDATATAANAVVIGQIGGDLGALVLAGITNSSQNAAGVTISGATIDSVTSSAAIQTDEADLTTGTILIEADNGIAGGVEVNGVNGHVSGGGAGAATVTIEADQDDDGTGAFGPIDVEGNIGNDANSNGGLVLFHGATFSTIDSPNIGLGGPVTFTTGASTNVNGVIGAIGGSTQLASLGVGGAVIFQAHDGISADQDINVSGSIAAGANVTFNANADGVDDNPNASGLAVPNFQAGTMIGSGATQLIVNTNGAATDNANARSMGTVTALDGYANLNLTVDGDVGLLTVSGDNSGNGNDLLLTINTRAADGNANNEPATPGDLAGINVVDTANNDSVTIAAASWISGIIGDTETPTQGMIIAGGGEATDQFVLTGNLVIFNGDDTEDGATDTVDADYAATTPFFVDIISGATAGGGQLIAAVRTSSPFFRAVLNSETFLADVDTPAGVTATVTYQLVTDQIEDDDDVGGDLSHLETDPRITLDDINGLTGASELTISTSGPSEFDSGGITRSGALGAVNPDAQLISVEGDLYGDIGEPTRSFGNVEIIIIAGDASAANANGGANHTFHGTGLQGLGVGLDNDFIDGDNDDLPDTPIGFSSLLLGPNVIITTLDRDTSEPLTLPGTLNFQFADANAGGSFNRHINVVGVGSQAIVYGIDGSGDSATALDAEYAFEGVGVSTAQPGATNDIDPSAIIDGYAMFARVNITDVDGISTDVSVREVDGTTTGSWFEFNTDLGLFNVTTAVSSISVGVDDGSDVLDNAVVTGNNTNNGNGTDFDRLGGGEAGGLKQGLQPATFISDEAAGLGNFVAQSMTDPGAANINVVVTGDLGDFTLTGDVLLQNPDHGNLVVNAGAGSAAIAVGDDLEGDLVIPGLVGGDILIGIGKDLNSDNDVVDSGLTEITNNVALGLVSVGHDLDGDGLVDDANMPVSGWTELPSGDANGTMIIGSMGAFDILVYDNINNDIVIRGADQDPELAGLELIGDVAVIKAGGDLGNAGEDDDVVVAGHMNFAIADGALNADIFTGGHDEFPANPGGLQEATVIEGVGITGAAVLGGAHGIDIVTIINHAVFGDTGDIEVITSTNRDMVVQWAADGITNDTIGDVYIVEPGAANFNVTSPYGDGLTVGDIYVLDQPAAGMAITSTGTIGVVVVADDATIPTSETLLDGITADYEVLDDAPTALDTASGDEGLDLNFNGTITADNCGGMVAEGNVTLVANVDAAMGYIVALNGSIDGDVHAGVSIGHIVASEDIDGEFISEGVLAIGNADGLQTDLTSFGLSGVPLWFPGGILSEVGDIGSNNNEVPALWTGTTWFVDLDNDNNYDNDEAPEAVFRALADPTIVQGAAFWTGEAMGTFYVPAGDMSADIDVGGDFGGIQVPSGKCWVELNVPMEALVSRVIAPQFVDNGGNAQSSWDRAGVRGGIRVIDGELVAVIGAAIDTDGLDVEVFSPTALAIVDGTDILLVDGLADDVVGNEVVIQGNVHELVFNGDWDGQLVIEPNADDDSNGEVDTIIVTDNLNGSGDLEAYNFGELLVQGTNAAESTGSLAGRDAVTFTNLAGETQTVFLDGSNRVSANYTTMFGKMTELQITGNGKAGVLSVNGAYDAVTDLRELRQISKAARTGKANANLGIDGSAHLGNLEIALGSRINVKDAVVNGDLDALSGVSPKQNIKSLWVSEDAGTVDIGNKINRAFIGGDVDEFSARVANKVLIGGDATNVNAFKMMRSSVIGTTTNLTIDGTLIYSVFADVINANVNNSYRSVIG